MLFTLRWEFDIFNKKALSILTIVLLLLLLVFSSPKVEATSGCCSWHGGVCGCDTSIGREICCDGSYSPSCTCSYIPHTYPTLPPRPTFPDIKAQWKFYANKNRTWTIKMKALDNNPTMYSAVISKCAGCNPGPLVDFYSSNFTFNNVAPGRWYVNVKKKVNDYWSNTVYWTINVPAWREPTPTPTILINNDYQDETDNSSSEDYNSSILKLVVGLVTGGLIAHFVTKKIDKPNV